MFYFSIGLTVLANLLYHIFQKSISTTVNPIISLIVTYTTALVISFLILPFFPTKMSFLEAFREVNWASYALALGIIGLEIGFLFVYRSGWNISLAAIISNVAVTILLVPVGLLFFKETVTIPNIIGVVLCISGIILVNWK